jgi:hypothetical protein
MCEYWPHLSRRRYEFRIRRAERPVAVTPINVGSRAILHLGGILLATIVIIGSYVKIVRAVPHIVASV